MTENSYEEPSKAEQLAALVSGKVTSTYMGATVQRSHRFPLHLFIQIENMANMGGMSISTCINELIESGLEAVKNELPEDALGKLILVSKKQLERPTKSVHIESHVKKPASAKGVKARTNKS